MLRAVDLIDKKRRGSALSDEELSFLVKGYLAGDVPDYQMSAWLMAVAFHGMSDAELSAFTACLAQSGETLDLSLVPGVKVDKHSTGGVGDKTTIVIAPLLAALGVPMIKMSGRGLGHTGGTIDKLESIPGFRTDLTIPEMIAQVERIGVALAGQTAELAPADKRIYALRDVTATVESLPLIASSVMSKKLASGADAIVLDVKVGDGAFMKTLADAKRLARTMVEIGNRAGRRTVAVLSSMEQPLGQAIGNALEIAEAIAVLRGEGPQDLTEVCLALASEMAVLAGVADDAAQAREMLQDAIADGRALAKLRAWVAAQGGDAKIVDDPARLPQAPVKQAWTAPYDGFVKELPALAFGSAAMRLGAGRSKKDDIIHPAVGIVVHKKVGDRVNAGEPVFTVHAIDQPSAQACIDELTQIIRLVEQPVSSLPLLLGRVPGGDEDADELLAAAQRARKNAYVPYSGFAVGAALRLTDGRIIEGANIENASYGLTNCAERTAIFAALAAGRETQERPGIAEIAVVADAPEPVSPCGACRQVMAEFCPPETPVVLANLQGDVLRTTVGSLLPGAFGAAQMVYTRVEEADV
ncbi:pyrimidine-nucleoside phosphorylase [Alicyclobacillus hesperidum]|uniref:pyrimidine-nucleoside phosphorylase n=1 Tax=Alicyclobacillus hesperidum TaxID=89784 RepID=UPI000316605F|nr:pyrimidine-nucleoside phosphorylase [Alicyclobacillus hesperidum]